MKFIIKEEVGVTACATDDSEMDEEDGDEDEVLISWNLESQFSQCCPHRTLSDSISATGRGRLSKC